MPLTFHSVGNNLFTLLAAPVADVDLSIVVNPSGLDALAVPFFADLGGEVVAVSAVDADTPGVGQTTWTVARAVYGSAGNYAAGIPVAQRNYAENLTEIHTTARAAWAATLATLGGSHGVITPMDLASLEVTPADDGVAVLVNLGVAVNTLAPVFLAAPVELALTPPDSGTTNYQILIDAQGVVSANEEDAEEDAPAGYVILADVEVGENDTEILEAAITDRREFL
jgi:hypothetical protein